MVSYFRTGYWFQFIAIQGCQTGTEGRERGIVIPILKLGIRRGWVVNATPRPLYPQ
jgi:hypothetical protein